MPSLPTNSAILIFELGSPEFIAASRAQDLVATLTTFLEQLRSTAKHGVQSAPVFDFREALGCTSVEGAVQASAHAIRCGLLAMLEERNINIDTL